MEATIHSLRSLLFAPLLAAAVLWVPRPCDAHWMATCVPDAETSEYGVVFGVGYSTTDYDVGGSRTDVTRLSVGGAVSAYALDWLGDAVPAGALDWLNVYVGASYIVLSSPKDWKGNGNGFTVAGGVKAGDWTLGPVHLTPYGHVQYTDESFGSSRLDALSSHADADASATDVILGVNAQMPIHDVLDVYAGLSVCPFTDGDLTASTTESTITLGWERSGQVDLAMGAVLDLEDWRLHAEVNLLGETAVIIAASLML